MKATSPTLAEDPQEVELRYLARVREACQYLESEGVDRQGEDRRHAELERVFVMLHAVESTRREALADVAPVQQRAEEMGIGEKLAVLFGRDKSLRPGESPSKPPPPPVPLSQALKAYEHLVILGEPGAGKSTVLQYIALCYATLNWAEEQLDVDDDRIPLWVELRAYDGSVRLDKYLMGLLLNHPGHVSEGLAGNWLEQGRLVVLLDGLDEISSTERRRDVSAQIAGFANHPQYRQCRIVLTSRIAGYDEVRGGEPVFGCYTICPFSGPDDALPYVAGWVAALNPAAVDAAQDQAQALFDRMQGQRGLRRVMSNPLLLRLAVAVYVESGEAPENRAELYQRYVREVAWKRANGRETACWSLDKIEAALEAVAWTLQIRGEQTRSDLIEPVEGIMSRVAQCSEPVTYLQQNLGLLASYGEQQGQPLLAFRHLTFQEYFVASRLKRAWIDDPQRAWRFLRPRLHHPAWREPILLLASSLDEEQASELARQIWRKAHSPYEHVLKRDLLLAASLSSDGVHISPELSKALTRAVVQLYLDADVAFRDEIIGLLLSWVPAGILWFIAAKCLHIDAGWLQVVCFVVWIALFLLARLWRIPLLGMLFSFPEHFSGKSRFRSLERRVRSQLDSMQADEKQCASVLLLRVLHDWKWRTAKAVGRRLESKFGSRDLSLVSHGIGYLFSGGDRLLRAIQALGAVGDRDAVPSLINELDVPLSDLSRAAAKVLGQIGDADATLPLLEALNAYRRPNALPETEVVQALGRIKDPRAVPVLASLVGSEPRWLCEGAIHALGQIGHPGAIEALSHSLREQDFLLRIQSAEALGAIRSPVAEGALISGLSDENPLVRDAAAQALGQLGTPEAIAPILRAQLDVHTHIDRSVASNAIASIGRRFTPVFVHLLRGEKLHWRLLAAQVLGAARTSSAVVPLIEALSDDDAVLRSQAALSLGEIATGQPVQVRVLDPLIQLLNDPIPDVQTAAAIALGNIGDTRGADSLVVCVRHDPDSHVRAAAAFSLGQIGDLRTLDTLLLGSADADARVREASVAAVGKIGKLASGQAIELLCQALGDSEARVRRQAALALGRLGRQEAVPALVKAVRDADPLTAQLACERLAELDPNQAVETLTEMSVGQQNWFLRNTAIRTLGHLRDRRVTELLLKVLSDATEGDDLRFSAAVALGKARDSRAVESLMAILVDPTTSALVANAVQGALAEIGPPALEPLTAALRDKDEQVRLRASWALADLSGATASVVRMVKVDGHWIREAAEVRDWEVTGDSLSILLQELRTNPTSLGYGSFVGILGTLVPYISNPRVLGRISWAFYMRLTMPDGTAMGVAECCYEALESASARLTELEVAAPRNNPPLFAPAGEKRRRRTLLIALSAIAAAILGVTVGRISAYLGKQFNLETNTLGMAVVAVVFVLVLTAGILITLRLERPKG